MTGDDTPAEPLPCPAQCGPDDPHECETCHGTGTDDYTCQVCGETYAKIRGDDEALSEMLAEHPDADPNDVGLTCDDCYQRVTAWWQSQSAQAKQTIKDAYHNA